MATVTGSPERSGLVSCGHWMMPTLWSGGRADKISNKLAGDIVCLGGSMVEHQLRVLEFRVRFPAGVFAIFFRFCQSFTSNSLSLSSFPFSFPSSSFPFLFLSLSFSLQLFVCAKKKTHLRIYLIETSTPMCYPVAFAQILGESFPSRQVFILFRKALFSLIYFWKDFSTCKLAQHSKNNNCSVKTTTVAIALTKGSQLGVEHRSWGGLSCRATQ